MAIGDKYLPGEVESKWYEYWMRNGFFHSEPDEREPYTVVIPPPNVTGVLHMGHMLNNTIQDILVRRARMQGKNACWVPGTDHASIATEAKVVAKLAAEGIKKSDLTREEFLTHAWEWTHKHGGIILEQLKKLGCSCDWERTCFTMDEKRSQSVIKVFCDLYQKGKIYRGVRMVNWDPQALTALSDEEVIHKEQQGKLYYIKYKIVEENNEKTESWEKIKEKIYCKDGSLRDIYACCTTKNDWKKFVDYVNENYKIEFINNDTEEKFDKIDFDKVLEFWNDNEKTRFFAKIYLDKIQINTFFFDESEIDNDISPNEFNSIEDHSKLVKYLNDISKLLNKEIVVTEENCRYSVLFSTDDKEYAVVATTRPETIFGDTAMCINPNNPKTAHLKGKKVYVPLINREIPVIEDEYVDMEFGTGCLKVTPAHDVNDYMLGEKYNLPSIDIFNDNGSLNENGAMYAGMDRFDCRKKIEKDLDDAGLLEKVEPYTNKVGFSERTGVAIEPKLSMQWFLKMEDLAKPALEAVENDTIKFYPTKFKNTYRHWMENIKDWCISRQLWWGHQIPAYYLPQGGFVVAETKEEAYQKALSIVNYPLSIDDLRQDEDCLDTWFSSWLWPLSVFDGINNPDNKDINYYYPTNDLVTAPEIIFFWVARMIMSGYEYRGKECFKNVYFTGIVRDKLGRKMSKSLGNSPDPIELMNKYGADGVRMGMLLSSPAGNDLPFDESLCEQGRNFNNKIWNAFRLMKGWEVDTSETLEKNHIAMEWFCVLLSKTIDEIDDLFSKYRLSEALTLIYKVFWDDFCSWYLEIIKPEYGKPIDKATYDYTLILFEELLKLLHPFMPFITEELYHSFDNKKENVSIMFSPITGYDVKFKKNILPDFEESKEIITNIRNIRASKNISPKEKLTLQITGEHHTEHAEVIVKLANVTIENVSEKSAGAVSFMVGTTEYAVLVGNLINAAEEIAKMETEIKYLEGFLKSVSAKLSNEKFVANAKPEIVENERKKQTDAESKIKALNESLEQMRIKN